MGLYLVKEEVKLVLFLFHVGAPELGACTKTKYVVLTLEITNFLFRQISVYLYLLDYNKFIGFYTLSVIPTGFV